MGTAIRLERRCTQHSSTRVDRPVPGTWMPLLRGTGVTDSDRICLACSETTDGSGRAVEGLNTTEAQMSIAQ